MTAGERRGDRGGERGTSGNWTAQERGRSIAAEEGACPPGDHLSLGT